MGMKMLVRTAGAAGIHLWYSAYRPGRLDLTGAAIDSGRCVCREAGLGTVDVHRVMASPAEPSDAWRSQCVAVIPDPLERDVSDLSGRGSSRGSP